MILKRKVFSDNEKKSGLDTFGNVALGVGAASGLAAGAHYGMQALKVNKVVGDKFDFGSKGFRDAMNHANELSKGNSFTDINKMHKAYVSRIKKAYNGAPLGEYQGALSNSKYATDALKHSKLKRMAGRTALAAAGIGLGAKLLTSNKKKDSNSAN